MYRLINWAFDHFNTLSPVLIQTPNHRSFGNGTEEVFYGLLRARRESKKVLFLYPRFALFGKFIFTVVNRERFHLQSDHAVSNDGVFGLLGGLLLSFYVGCLRVTDWLRHSSELRKVVRIVRPAVAVRAEREHGYVIPQIGRSALWRPRRANSFSLKSVADLHWPRQYEEYTPPTLTADRQRRAEQRRVQMGLPLAGWFVCLHVSENCPRIPRNASIHNYFEAIKVVTNAGGWVVRLGDPSMTPLPSMERVIDYAHSRHRSESLDLYLISQCHFFVGLSSGPPLVATLFRKPLVIVNMTQWQ